MTLRSLLLKEEYWTKAYEKLILKNNISKGVKNELTVLYTFERETLVDELLNGNYKWSIPQKIEISKHGTNRKRVVYIYSEKDRLVQGVLYRACSEYFKDKISKSCYSYKTSQSTSSAIKYILNNKTENYKYGVKIDIHSYFNSVSKQRLIEMIDELFKDTELYKSICDLMLSDKVSIRGNLYEEYKSLTPGSPIASFFANYCLRECDLYFDKLPIIYARYSDDIIIIDEKKENLQGYLDVILNFLNKYGLTLNPDKYTWFEEGDEVSYLGLKIDSDGNIDISDHAFKKIKKQIHRWCRKGRVRIERDKSPFEKEARFVFKQLNNKNFKCYVRDNSTFGWCHYAFRYITTTKTLEQIDKYTVDTMRAMYTGKHNKANNRHLQNGELEKLGYVSMVQLYKLYKEDFDYYCEVIELL